MGGFGTTQWGKGEWGAPPAPPAVAATSLDTANSINDVWYRLGFLSEVDMETAGRWVSLAELYQFADDAAKKIAYESGVFMGVDASIAVAPGTGVYELPATHVFTMLAWLATGSSLQLLRLNPVRTLWALDANWSTTTGNPTRCSLDAGSVGTITLYPNPIAGGTLNQVCQEFPATVAPGASTLPLPPILQDYFTYAMLAGARGKESDAAMPEMAQHFKQRCDLYEQAIAHLWGAGQ